MRIRLTYHAHMELKTARLTLLIDPAKKEAFERQDFEGLRQDRGRFRAFLLASLKHYLSNWSARERTQKRGGGRQMVPLENAEGQYVVEPVNHATPETLFERRWALTVVDGLLADLRAQWTAQERASEFDELKACLLGQAPVRRRTALAVLCAPLRCASRPWCGSPRAAP